MLEAENAISCSSRSAVEKTIFALRKKSTITLMLISMKVKKSFHASLPPFVEDKFYKKNS